MRLTRKAGISLFILIQHKTPSGSGCGKYSRYMSHHTPPPPGNAGLSSHFNIFIIFHTIYNNYSQTRSAMISQLWLAFKLASLPPWGVTWTGHVVSKSGGWTHQLFETKHCAKIYGRSTQAWIASDQWTGCQMGGEAFFLGGGTSASPQLWGIGEATCPHLSGKCSWFSDLASDHTTLEAVKIFQFGPWTGMSIISRPWSQYQCHFDAGSQGGNS